MPWQQHVADVILEIDPLTGQLAYQEFGLTVPRQSGKSTLLLAKAVHRASATKFFGSRQKIIYTAQTRKDARQKFEVDYVEDLNATPRLKATPRMGNGTEHVRFPNGSRFGIEASTEKAGHGQTIDEAYIDEAFAQVDGRLEQAFRPAMITRRNKQLGWISTAGWSDGSPYLQAKVAKGRAHAEMGIREGLAYFEWSAPEDAALDDRDVWRLCMPALGHTISEASIAHELATMENPNDFRRAYLNQWVPKSAAAEWSVIPRAAWLARQVEPVRPDGPVAFAVAAAWPEAESAAIAVAGRRDGLLLVQVHRHDLGTSWVVDEVKRLRDKHRPAAIVVDQGGPAGRLITDLETAGVELVKANTADAGEAYGQFMNAVVGDAPFLGHFGQDELDAAVAAAQKRPLGDRWTWARKGATDISPLEAVTLAAWGHSTRALQSRVPNLW